MIQDLAVAYNGKRQSKISNEKIPEKAVTALIGPSGCGKLHFLRTINRMHDLTKGAEVSGKIIIDGENVYDAYINPILSKKKRLAWCFKNQILSQQCQFGIMLQLD